MKNIVDLEQQTFLPRPLVTQLNGSRGVVLPGQLDSLSIDPLSLMTLADYAGQVGFAMSEYPPKNSQSDQSLEVYGNDFDRALPTNLNRGLYFPKGDRRLKFAIQAIIINCKDSDLIDTGAILPSTGIAVSEAEYLLFPRSAGAIRAKIEAQTRNANSTNPILEEVDAKSGRSIVHGLTEKKMRLNLLDAEYYHCRSVLGRVHKAATAPLKHRQAVRQLENDRRFADELIHEFTRVACINLDYGTTVVNGIHRALASRLHRRKATGSSEDIAESWRQLTVWAGLYNSAKRGKARLAQMACDEQIAHYLHWMKTAEDDVPEAA